jgi:uroporphyrinogen decarboxylase
MQVPPNASIDGIGVLHVRGSMYHFTHYVSPLRNARRFEEIESFPYEHANGFSADHMSDQVRAIHAKGMVASSWVGHMYEDSWQIRGYEEFLMDMISNPEWCEFILDKITEKNIAAATAAATAGVDVIDTGDDVASQNALMFSLDQWRGFMKTRWAKVYAAARKIKPDIQIWYHSDGNILDIIPELIDIGVTILNPVQPECMDLVEVKKKFGKKIVLDGTIGTQTTMPFGTPDEVKKVVKERVETLGRDGALILSPTHVLEPEVPIANIQAFVEAAKGV